jgi:hypothetical protein
LHRSRELGSTLRRADVVARTALAGAQLDTTAPAGVVMDLRRRKDRWMTS